MNPFNLLDDIFIVGIPNWRFVFNNRSNIGLVTLKFNISITCSKISLQKLPFEIGTALIIFACVSRDSLLLMVRGHRHSIFGFFNGIYLLRLWSSPPPLLTANQNLLKNSCLQQLSPPHQTPFLFFHHDYHHLLHACFRCAHPKNTPPQCLNNYMQCPKCVRWRTISHHIYPMKRLFRNLGSNVLLWLYL